ncbi:uncharacterized protein LOC113797984 [Dermatophagoides pteronyssinus]|uniref:uncharacterized protein LOC113797984 n=1 Tax=Dermatophagoides pteronyssinus TaxID=6956 RepID=UPI003F664411
MMANYINENLNLLNDSYHIMMMSYHNQSCRSFWSDLRQTIFHLIPLNNYFFTEILCILLGTWIFWNLRRLWFEKFIDNLIANKILFVEHRYKFDENFWVSIHRIILFLFALKIVSETNDYINIGNHNINVSTQVKLFFLFDICEYIRATIELVVGVKKYKDKWVFISHHMITIGLITLSYMTRQHLIGVLTIYILESSSIFVYSRCILKLQFGWIRNYLRMWRVLLFLILLIVWTPNRLYEYPFNLLPKVGHTTRNYCQLEAMSILIILYSFLYFIYLVNIYWTFLIIKSLYIIYQYGMENFENHRDTDVMKKLKQN